jgi:hypothetical protein
MTVGLLSRPVYRAYHAGMHADYECADDVVAAFDSLGSRASLRAMCSAAKAGSFQFALLRDGSKFMVEYTQVRD